MPPYRISLVNQDFTSTTESELDEIEQVRTQALKGALQIGTDEICSGQPFFAAEIIIEDNRERVERMLVSVGKSSLKS